MFQLSQTHNQAFQSKAEADFVREVMEYLRENHAETIVKLPNGEFKIIDLPKGTLQKMVEGGITKARSYGMTWQSTLISFVVIMFVSAPNFDEYKYIQEVLLDEQEFPDRRINNLWVKTNNEIWDEVIKNYEPNHWDK